MVDHLVHVGFLGVVDGHVAVLLRVENVNALLGGGDLLASLLLLLHLHLRGKLLVSSWLLLRLHLHLLPSLHQVPRIRLGLLGELQGKLLVLLGPVELILNLVRGRGVLWLGRIKRKDIEEFLSEQRKDSADIFITLVGRWWALLSQNDKKAGLVILLVSVGLGDRKR